MDVFQKLKQEASKVGKQFVERRAKCNKCGRERSLTVTEIAGYVERRVPGGGGGGVPCKDCMGGVMFTL